MLTLLEREKDRYEELINGMPEYLEHSPGEKYAELFMEMSGAKAGDSVLDAGCCSGKGGLALKALGLQVMLQDITSVGLRDEALDLPFLQESLWIDPDQSWLVDRHDWVFCCDVMEHIPTEFVMLTLRCLCRRARKGAFFTVGLTTDQFGMFIGQPLHLTVQPYVWWRDRLKDVAVLKESRDFLNTGIFLTDG